MSSLSRRYRLAQSEASELMPPNTASMGSAPFGGAERARLSAWLQEPGWPRDHMGHAELEGYLVALIAWPVDIPSGAWLPPIWGETGWKIPANIAMRPKYEQFVGLIIGFMQLLDHELARRPCLLELSVLHGLKGREHAEATRSWGRGFMKALALGSQGLKWRSASARAAVRAIAGSTSVSGPIRPDAGKTVFSAISSLMEQRASRGPLGQLGKIPRPRVEIGEP